VLEEVKAAGFKAKAAEFYQYVEIQRVGIGTFDYEELRGWQLPSRAKLRAEVGDIFIASIWSSAGKWFMAGGVTTAMVVTNGFTRLRLKAGMEEYLPDIVAGLSSEAFRVQMRGYATGSDGLAEIPTTDLLDIVLPKLQGEDARKKLGDTAARLRNAEVTLERTVDVSCAGEALPKVPRRKDHWALV